MAGRYLGGFSYVCMYANVLGFRESAGRGKLWWWADVNISGRVYESPIRAVLYVFLIFIFIY